MMSFFVDYNFFNPKIKLLSDRYELIREEYLSNRHKLEFKDFTQEQNKNISEFGKGYPIEVESYFSALENTGNKGWHLAGLKYQNHFYSRNSNFLPVLSDTLNQISSLNACAINVLDSEISLNWHNDDDYYPGIPTLRILWGLDVPVEDGKESIIQMKDPLSLNIETKKFENNQFYCFWPTTEHRVENTLSFSRSVVSIDLLTT